MLGPVENVGLGGFGIVGGNQLFLHNILGLLYGGGGFQLFQLLHHLPGELIQVGIAEALGGNADIGLEDRGAYFGRVKLHLFPITLDNFFWHF